MNAPDLSSAGPATVTATMTALEWSRKHKALLRTERAVLAELLLSLAEFESRDLHRELGYASLFDYLHRELGLSRGMSHYRQVAVRLVQKFPDVVEPLRDGRLCLTTVVELARVMTPGNRADVLSRFFHRSREEARQLAAEIAPRDVVPRRTVVTVEVAAVRASPPGSPIEPGPMAAGSESTVELGRTGVRQSSTVEPGLTEVRQSSTVELGLTDVSSGQADGRRPALEGSIGSQRTRVDPLTATVTRLHLTVSPEFVTLLRRTRAGQSHVQPGATDEQVLTAALELLVERQQKRSARVPARVKREVVRRDGGRCQWPTHDGGVCGSTVRLEVDHVVPRGKGGPDTVANCRLLCDRHNQEAARSAYGDAHMDRFVPRVPVAREAGEGMWRAGGDGWEVAAGRSRRRDRRRASHRAPLGGVASAWRSSPSQRPRGSRHPMHGKYLVIMITADATARRREPWPPSPGPP